MSLYGPGISAEKLFVDASQELYAILHYTFRTSDIPLKSPQRLVFLLAAATNTLFKERAAPLPMPLVEAERFCLVLRNDMP